MNIAYLSYKVKLLIEGSKNLNNIRNLIVHIINILF